MMRRVTVKETVWNRETRKAEHHEYEAMFHAFGVDHNEFTEGPGNYSTAIVELSDGTIKNPNVLDVKFIDGTV